MPKSHAFSQEQYKEVVALEKQTTDAKLLLKLQVLQLRMEGYKNEEIAQITKYSKSRVSALVCIYDKYGIDYFKQENRAGGNHRNISVEEEANMLGEFKELAGKGQLITVKQIKAKYESIVGHSIGSGQIYRVLERNGWRKVMPRSKHPNKASDEVIEASKKLNLVWRPQELSTKPKTWG